MNRKLAIAATAFLSFFSLIVLLSAVGYLATKNAKGEYGAGKLAILNTVTGKIEKEVGL